MKQIKKPDINHEYAERSVYMKKLLVVLALLCCFYCTEITKGTVVDELGNGHCDWCTHGVEEPFSYINYGRTGAEKGDEVVTLFLYEPWNRVDGIFFRYDVVIEK